MRGISPSSLPSSLKHICFFYTLSLFPHPACSIVSVICLLCSRENVVADILFLFPLPSSSLFFSLHKVEVASSSGLPMFARTQVTHTTPSCPAPPYPLSSSSSSIRRHFPLKMPPTTPSTQGGAENKQFNTSRRHSLDQTSNTHSTGEGRNHG